MAIFSTVKVWGTKVACWFSEATKRNRTFSFYWVSGACSSVDIDVDGRKKCRFEKSDNFLFCCLWIPLNGGHSRSTKPLRYFRYFLKPRLTTTLAYLFSIILAGKKLRTEKADSFPKPRKNGASRWEKQKSKKIVNLAIIDFIFVLFSGLPSSVWPEF